MRGSVNTGRTWCEPLEGITQSNESQTWYSHDKCVDLSTKLQGGTEMNFQKKSQELPIYSKHVQHQYSKKEKDFSASCDSTPRLIITISYYTNMSSDTNTQSNDSQTWYSLV